MLASFAADAAAEGDVLRRLDELARAPFLHDGQLAVAHLELCAGSEEAGEHDATRMRRDVDEAAASRREVGLGAELRDVDAAVGVDLHERQQGDVETAALEVGELLRGRED